MSSVTTEVVRRVYDDGEGVFIEVGPGPDSFGVHIGTEGKSAQWFGPVSLTISADIAKELGQALISCAEEQAGQ